MYEKDTYFSPSTIQCWSHYIIQIIRSIGAENQANVAISPLRASSLAINHGVLSSPERQTNSLTRCQFDTLLLTLKSRNLFV